MFLVDKNGQQIAAHGDIGRKYLADHSAGSGKTLILGYRAEHLAKVCEQILAKGHGVGRARRYGFVEARLGADTGSDHLPVVARLVWR